MRNITQKVFNRGYFHMLKKKTFQWNKKCGFSSSGYKIYSDGLINPHFSTDLKTIKESGAIPIYRILDTQGNLLEGHTAPFSDEEVLETYKKMVEFSLWDEVFYMIQRQGRISFYIVNEGEEGLQFGIGKALDIEDHLYCQYREAAVLLCRGFDYNCFMNQLFGTKYDEGKGRQMCISYTKKDLNIHTITTPLASQIAHAAGCGYALKLKKKKNVGVAFFGEGAASEGDFHAGLNFASVRNAQTMFVCKNNLYAISTHVKDQYKGDGIAPRAVALGIETIRVDGNDLFASYLASKKMREICVNESKPVFIEFITYRYSHHSTSDDCSLYKPVEENEAWRKKGVAPISRLLLYLKNKNLFDEKEDELYRKEIKKNILKELKKAESIKRYNIVGGLFENVYADEEWPIKEQRENFQKFFKKYGKYYNTSAYESSE